MARVEGDADMLRVTGALDFDTVVTLEPAGADWIRSGSGACHIDLAAVSYSSSAGLALLLAWLRCAAAAGRPVTIAGLPAELGALASVCGIEDLLPLAA